ncbi:MAG TPA: zinc ribbon domain-containing protein [Bacteroidota bacterium]|nr:zinc ribbon domain-containing protein [Bacteroidota bacterium]
MNCPTCGFVVTEAVQFCPNCGTSVQNAVAGQPAAMKSSSKTRRVALFLFPFVLITGTVIFLRYLNPSVHSVIRQQPIVGEPTEYGDTPVSMTTVAFRDEGGDLVFSLSELKRYRLVRFEYQGEKTSRTIMAYLAPTGQVVTAISFSEHCGSNEFTIRSNKIFCARCPSNWDMMTMEAYACCAKYYPDPIPSRVDGDEVRIPKLFVEKWAGRL